MRVRWRTQGGVSSWTEWQDCVKVEPSGGWIWIVFSVPSTGGLGGSVPGRDLYLGQQTTAVEIER